jgi:hypothetical protein
MPSDQYHGDEHEFDQLLLRAQWPEARSDQIARLAGHWRTIARRRRIARRVGALAIAATVLLAAGLWTLRDADGTAKGTIVARKEVAGARDSSAPKIRPTPQTQLAAKNSIARPAPPTWSVESRDANLYERVVLASAFAKRTSSREAPGKREAIKRQIDELVVLISATAPSEIDRALAQAPIDPARYEPLLWNIVRRESPEHVLGAARILARIGTAQSLPVLWDLLEDRATREPAILGLCRLASPADLARLATVEPDAQLRRNLLRALLARQTEESIGLYLGFVDQRSFRADALEAVAAMQDPPVDVLLVYLESSRRSVRLAAAQALGRVSGADIAQRLSGSVFRGIGRQEALLALLLSPTPQAASFLSEARRDLYLVASVQAAEQQLHALTIPSGGNLR